MNENKARVLQLFGNSSLFINTPIQLGYSSIPNSITMIGGSYSPTVTWTNSSDTVICSQSLPVGVYLLSFNIQTDGLFSPNFLYPSGIPGMNERWPFQYTGYSTVNSCHGSLIIQNNSPSIFTLKNAYVNTQTGENMVCYLTRIA
jgi:hypothetical protein